MSSCLFYLKMCFLLFPIECLARIPSLYQKEYYKVHNQKSLSLFQSPVFFTFKKIPFSLLGSGIHFSIKKSEKGLPLLFRIAKNHYATPKLKASCKVRTASSVYFSSIRQDIFISEVLIIRILIFSLDKATKAVAATPV